MSKKSKKSKAKAVSELDNNEQNQSMDDFEGNEIEKGFEMDTDDDSNELLESSKGDLDLDTGDDSVDIDSDDSDDDFGPSDDELEAIEEMRTLPVSESARFQDERKNTDTGALKNAGRTDEYIEIVVHRQPAVEAALRGQENVDKQTGTELPEGQEPAPDGADYKSGNSITGHTKPKAFAPWDEAKDRPEVKAPDSSKPDQPMGPSELPELPPAEADIGSEDSIGSDAPASVAVADEAAKDDLIANLELAGKATTENGQLQEDVDATNPAEDGAGKASRVNDEQSSDSTGGSAEEASVEEKFEKDGL